MLVALMEVCRTRATILLSSGEVLCCAERDAEWISYSTRSPEVLIKKMFKFCLSLSALVQQCHLQDEGCKREKKAGISRKGQFCCHTQCMVSQHDIFAAIEVQSLSSVHDLISQFDHPNPFKLCQTFLIEQETRISWNSCETWWGAKTESKAHH